VLLVARALARIRRQSLRSPHVALSRLLLHATWSRHPPAVGCFDYNVKCSYCRFSPRRLCFRGVFSPAAQGHSAGMPLLPAPKTAAPPQTIRPTPAVVNPVPHRRGSSTRLSGRLHVAWRKRPAWATRGLRELCSRIRAKAHTTKTTRFRPVPHDHAAAIRRACTAGAQRHQRLPHESGRGAPVVPRDPRKGKDNNPDPKRVKGRSPLPPEAPRLPFFLWEDISIYGQKAPRYGMIR